MASDTYQLHRESVADEHSARSATVEAELPAMFGAMSNPAVSDRPAPLEGDAWLTAHQALVEPPEQRSALLGIGAPVAVAVLVSGMLVYFAGPLVALAAIGGIVAALFAWGWWMLGQTIDLS